MRIEPSLAAILAIAIAAPVAAVTRTDAANDYLPTYTGVKNGDLDVLNFSAIRAGSGVVLSSTQNGAVGTTAGGIYVWGVNRGAGTAGFGVSLGLDKVLFDAVVVLLPNGTGRVVTFGASTVVTALAAGAVTVSGNTITGTVPYALLPSSGFTTGRYGYNLWPRIGGGTVANIADFAPNNATITSGAVPEPASWALMVAGFGLVGIARRRATLAASRTA
jgi:hypothetical protein